MNPKVFIRIDRTRSGHDTYKLYRFHCETDAFFLRNIFANPQLNKIVKECLKTQKETVKNSVYQHNYKQFLSLSKRYKNGQELKELPTFLNAFYGRYGIRNTEPKKTFYIYCEYGDFPNHFKNKLSRGEVCSLNNNSLPSLCKGVEDIDLDNHNLFPHVVSTIVESHKHSCMLELNVFTIIASYTGMRKNEFS